MFFILTFRFFIGAPPIGISFATTLGIGAQRAFLLTGDHVLRARLNASYGFYSSVNVQGFNAYGVGFGTQDLVKAGSVTTLTVAEYTLTRHVVLVLDISCQFVNATRFSGNTSIGVSKIRPLSARVTASCSRWHPLSNI